MKSMFIKKIRARKIVQVCLLIIAISTLYGVYITIPSAYALEDGWVVDVPATVNFPSTNWQVAAHDIEVTFPSAISISNTASTTQGFTATVTSTEPTHTVDPTLFMSYTNLQIKTNGLTSSPDQPAGVSLPIQNTYTVFSGILATSNALTFMTMDARSRSAGSWSTTPTIKLTIPQKQKPGTYEATLTLTLI